MVDNISISQDSGYLVYRHLRWYNYAVTAYVFPARAVNRGGFKQEHELKVTFLFNFLRLSEELK